MRTQKIRGHNRRNRQVDKWKETYSVLNIKQLKVNKYDYVKLWIHPWSGITFKDSWVPEPKKLIKRKMISGLFNIYENWKKQLEGLNEEYYLKIWLYEQRFSKSQVVCAIGDKIEYYNGLFEPTKNNSKSNPNNLTRDNFKWSKSIDYDYVELIELQWPKDQYINQGAYRYDRNLLKKCIDRNYTTSDMGENNKLFHIPKGHLFLGEKK